MALSLFFQVDVDAYDVTGAHEAVAGARSGLPSMMLTAVERLSVVCVDDLGLLSGNGLVVSGIALGEETLG